MSRSRKAFGAAVVAASLVAVASAFAQGDRPRFGFGVPATPQDIATWDIDVRPDGHGVKKGRGTVQQGQAVYDAKCAVCHGTFGESNSYLVIAGGVEPEDLKTGRASGLKSGEVRTVGTKLNYATTLWDYIYRAMPWTAPQSLTIDENYAVTAYVLHLNEIVPGDFELNERTILTVQMPNRNGFTTNHGMGSVKGKPDVQGTLCMKDCAGPVKVTSTLPDYARNAHGNLAEQKRDMGPFRGIDTRIYEPGGARVAVADTEGKAPAQGGIDAQELITRNACVVCHAVNARIVGPSFAEISARYTSRYAVRAEAETLLLNKIKAGGSGVWGPVPMPPQSNVKDDEMKTIVKWIFTLTQ
jgi:cytochrome c